MRALLFLVIFISMSIFAFGHAHAGMEGRSEGGAAPVPITPETALSDYVGVFLRDFAVHGQAWRDNPDAEGPFRIESGLSKICAYDQLPKTGDRRREGDLDLPVLGVVHVVREDLGDAIRFTETGRMDRAATPHGMELTSVETGTLALSDGALHIVTRVELDGGLAWRTVFETVRLPGGVWLAQFLFAANPGGAGGGGEGIWGAGCFLRFDESGYRKVEVVNPGPMDFSPVSLRGRGDIAPEVMAKGYGITKTIAIANGIVSAE